MSTTNVQNLLSNVFHPTFVYDTTNRVYKTNLELVNIDTVSANTVSSFFASIGDAQSNVYVGIGSGNAHSNMIVTSNFNTTFIGPGAGNTTSNVEESIFIGYNAGQNSTAGSSNTIAIGAYTDGDGDDNIYIGANTGVSNANGSNNIFIGHAISPGALSNQFLLGPLVKTSGYTSNLESNYLLGGSLTSNCLGINLSNPSYTLDVNGYARIGTNQVGGLGINTAPLNYTLDVNGDMRISDGSGTMTFTSDVNSNSVTTITPVLSNKTATLKVNDGFFSVSGTVTVPASNSSTIGQWKKGNVLISVINSGEDEYASGLYFCRNATTPTSNLMTNSTKSTKTDISSSGSNILIQSTNGVSVTYTYSITYFPLA